MGKDLDAGGAPDASSSGVEISVVGAGEIDMASAPELDLRLQKAIRTHPARVVVDLSAVTFLDSSGINTLVRAKNVGDGFGVELVLESPTEACQRVLKVAGLDVIFRIRP
jgi:anti-anti-sigma factor